MTLPDALRNARVEGPSAVAVGTFDGVHRGHQLLLGALVERARALGGPAVVVTFHPRPVEVLRPGVPSLYLGTLDRRVRLLKQAGADLVVPVPFTADLAQTVAEDFARALVEHLGMRELVGGPDLAFGRGREGTPDVLRRVGLRYGFDVCIVPPAEIGDDVVRSSTIQRVLAAGDVARAATLLGRPYLVEGAVVRGAGRGRQLGVPTANLAVPPNILLPANGIYAVRFSVAEKTLAGAASLGTNPTFGENPRTLEVHVLDFSDDLYGKTVEVEFIAYLRPEARFASVEDLVRQIHADVQRCREIVR